MIVLGIIGKKDSGEEQGRRTREQRNGLKLEHQCSNKWVDTIKVNG
jgi:hypothetical protein